MDSKHSPNKEDKIRARTFWNKVGLCVLFSFSPPVTSELLCVTASERKSAAIYAEWPDEIKNWKFSTLSGSNVPFNPLDPRGSPFVEDTVPDLKETPGDLLVQCSIAPNEFLDHTTSFL